MPVRRETMSSTTQCPACNTRFRVSQAQLDARDGLVRCGMCQAVFDATQFLHDDEPSPQLDLPIVEDVYPATAKARDIHAQDTAGARSKILSPVAFRQDLADDDLSDAAPERKLRWPWLVASLALLLVLLGQGAYSFRVELAANMPGLKPALVAYCGVLDCTVPLPQKADLMSIESSDLEADPAQANVIIFSATLRNRAPYAQAFPHLELTLTDVQDKPLARRTFRPQDYLKPEIQEKPGVQPSHDINIKLHLDTTELRPSGYRLFLYYP